MTASMYLAITAFFMAWTLMSMVPQSARQPFREFYFHTKEFFDVSERSAETSRLAIWETIRHAFAFQRLTTTYHICCAIAASIFCCLVCWVMFTSELFLNAATLFSMGFGDTNAIAPNLGLHNRGALVIAMSGAFWAMVVTDLVGMTHLFGWDRLHPLTWWMILTVSVICIAIGFGITAGFGLYRSDALDATIELLPLAPETAQELQTTLITRQQNVTRFCAIGMAGLAFMTAGGAAAGVFVGLQYPIYLLMAAWGGCLFSIQYALKLVRYLILGIFGFVIMLMNLFLRMGAIWSMPLARALRLREAEYEDPPTERQATPDWPEPEEITETTPREIPENVEETIEPVEQDHAARWDPYGLANDNEEENYDVGIRHHNN